MKDISFSEIETTIHKVLKSSLSLYGFNIPVLQNFTSAKVVKREIAVYFHIGTPRQVAKANRQYTNLGKSKSGDAGHIETQHFEAMVTFTCISNEELSKVNPSDLATLVAMITNSLPFIEIMRESGVGVQANSSIRTLYFLNEEDNYQLELSFDLPITFNRTIRPITQIANGCTLNKLIRI